MEIKSIINRFTVDQYMAAFLVILSFVSAFFYGFGAQSLLPILIAVAATAALDLAIDYFKFKTLEIPQSAIISGLFIGGLLTQGLQWYIYAAAAAIAILSKHLIRYRQKHIFNPANLGILLVSMIFGVSHTWWISSPMILALIFGFFMIWRLRRLDLAISFAAAYFALVLLINIFNPVACGMMNMRCHMQPSALDDFYYTIINGGVIYFFAMYMLIEPKTNPAQRKQRIIYGALVAVLLIAFHSFIPRHELPLALAAGNLFVPLLNNLNFEAKRKDKAEMTLSESIKRTDY